jgi:hypothetical protein
MTLAGDLEQLEAHIKKLEEAMGLLESLVRRMYDQGRPDQCKKVSGSSSSGSTSNGEGSGRSPS